MQCCLFVLCTFLLFIFFSGNPVQAGCSDIRRCCPGKDTSCRYEYGSRNRYTRACYCDEFCQKSGDCCDDYKEHCQARGGNLFSSCQYNNWMIQCELPITASFPPIVMNNLACISFVANILCIVLFLAIPSEISFRCCSNCLSKALKLAKGKDALKRPAQDCIMTYWSHWSHCTARCGKGMRERRRQVHVAPSNGGKPCGERRQTRGCYHNDRRCRNSEIAQLLPSYLNRKRNEKDIYERPSVLRMMKKRRKSYCVNYRIESIAWYCRYASPYHVLNVGERVCVECHDTAMDQEGHCQGATLGMLSRWRAMEGRSCSGSWESEGNIVEDCRCGETPGKDFVFV